ncbi:hypothetical protein V8G54_002905 [Vigna mungo]|uniref:Transposase MuDR plant domain-containing protein n=1 Tax=Vigna mungo TaxID=3915 RepID=A0AAQ3SD45_VIGMU
MKSEVARANELKKQLRKRFKSEKILRLNQWNERDLTKDGGKPRETEDCRTICEEKVCMENLVEAMICEEDVVVVDDAEWIEDLMMQTTWKMSEVMADTRHKVNADWTEMLGWRQSPISLLEKTRSIQASGDANRGKLLRTCAIIGIFCVCTSGPLPVNDGLVGCKFVPCPPVGVGVGERIKIVVHHTGKFLTDDNGVFKFDGEIAEWRCDADLLSYFGIVASVKELDRLELLTDDKGVMHMLNIVRLNDKVHLYVVHNMVEPQIIEFIDWVGGEEGYGVDVEVHTEGDGQEGGEVQVEGVEVQVEGGEVQDEVQVEDAGVDEVQDGEVQGEVHHVEEPEVHEVDDFEVEDLGEDDDVEDSDGDELHENESEAESEEEDLHDVSVECDIGYYKGNDKGEHSSPVVESSESSDNENNMDAMRGLSDNEWLSEELISDVEESEGEEDGGSSKSKTTFPTFSMPRSMDGYKWEVGTFFAEKKEFMDAIRTYALGNGRNMKFIKNDKKRIIVKCLGGKGKCNCCSRDFNVKLMTSKWLSERIEKYVRENPSMKVMDIRDKVTRKWNVGISRNMAFRARAMAKDKIEGSFHEQYKRLYDYGQELLKTNLGLTVQIKVENKESWTWFLELLIEDLGGKDVCAGITFISDQQKGLLGAFKDLLPGVEQRFCVRHLYSNFRKTFPGKNLKRLLWRATIATHPQQWEDEMRNIKAINVEAFKYLLSIPPRFTPRSQCDTLVNNMSEAFNSVLIDSRSKPIISMLEDIRVYIMKRWAANKTKMTQYHASICPKVWNRFQKESSLGRYWYQGGQERNYLKLCIFQNLASNLLSMWTPWTVHVENGQLLAFLVTPYSDILPPKKKTMPGRPKKKRRLEDELRKGGQRKKCVICHELGHNKKGCPQRPNAQSASEQTQGTQGPPTDVPLTQESTVIATESGPPQQPDPTVNDK